MTVYRLTTYGDPQPKGSMKCIGGRGPVKHQLIEDDKTGARKTWRSHLTAAAEALAQRLGEPLDGPVTVGALFFLDRPPSNRSYAPITRTSGDVDKHLRMVLDSLTDAAVLVDDSRVTFTLGGMAWALDRRPGAIVYVARSGPGIPGRILNAMLTEAPELELRPTRTGTLL